MTVKQFFKSTAFKCIATLLCVLLVCGIFLTIMHGLLEVTAEEKLSRAISKIYGKDVTTEVSEIKNKELDLATIEEAYCVTSEGGNYLVKSTGKGGFAGTVTCWVVVEIDGNSISGIGKVTVDSYVGETQMAEIKQSFLDSFGENYKDGIYYTTDDGFKVASSTRSSNAICNAVNGAIQYVKAEKLGIELDDKFKDFTYTQFINKKATTFKAAKDSGVTYNITTNGYGAAAAFELEITVSKDKTITAFKVVTDGSTDGYEVPSNIPTMLVGKKLADITAILGEGLAYPGDEAGSEINTGASNSTYICYTAAAFALANYDIALASIDIFENFEYVNFINKSKSNFTVNEDSSVTYNITTKGYGATVAFVLEVTVGADKTITAFKVVTDGSTEGYETPSNIATTLTGKKLADITAILGEGLAYPGDEAGTEINTGASNSTYECYTTAAFALANYDNCVPAESDGGEVNE